MSSLRGRRIVILPGQYFDEETGLHYNYFRDYDSDVGRYLESDPLGLTSGLSTYLYADANPLPFFDPNGLERKPGRTPPKSWPIPPPKNVVGKKPSWNPEGYWDGKNGRRITWDDRSHGAGIDRGQGAQGGHWDDETSNNRWDEDGNPLPGSDEYQKAQNQKMCPTPVVVGGAAVVGGVIGCALAPEVCAAILGVGGAATLVTQ